MRGGMTGTSWPRRQLFANLSTGREQALSPQGLRTVPSPSALRSPWGSHFHVKISAAGPGAKGASRTEAPAERPARPPGLLPFAEERTKILDLPWGASLLGCWLHLSFAGPGSSGFLMLGSPVSATVSLSFCPKVFSLTCLLPHLLKAPAPCLLRPLSPERLEEVGGQREA